MHSDPKDCLYCTNNQTLHDLMIEIAPLSVSRAFLFKEQTYHGRCLVAYNGHVNDLNELSDEQRNAFMSDVARVTRAIRKCSIRKKSTTELTVTSSPTFTFTSHRNMWTDLIMEAHSR